MSNQVLNLLPQEHSTENSLRGFDKTLRQHVENIRQYIEDVPDETARQRYQSWLDELMASQTRKHDGYFYTELFDEIKEAERTRHFKHELHTVLSKLDSLHVHEDCLSAFQQLQHDCRDLLNRHTLKPRHMEDIRARFALLHSENTKKAQDDLVQQRTRQFIKEQLIISLRNLNYDVMEGMEVIDFERQSDFLLKIPKQDNYIRLRFMEDGSFRYNFYIPEFEDELSIKQIQMKIHEMESACRSFKQHLDSLREFGISVEVEKELPISQDVVIQVPRKFRDIVHVKKKKTSHDRANNVRTTKMR